MTVKSKSAALWFVFLGFVLSGMSCSSGGATACGSNTIESGEVCDGTALAGKSCTDFGSIGGTLACKTDCADFDTTACQALASCGNGALDDPEVCDGALLNGHTCQLAGFGGGNLKCQANCLGVDTSGCAGTCAPVCGGRVCGPDPVCGKDCGQCTGVHQACGMDGQCALSCDQDPIVTDQSLNLDLNVVTVTGTLTVGGAVLPDGARPVLLFQNNSSGTTKVVPLPTTGAATYTVKLWKGAYDIVVRDDAGAGVLGIGQSLAMQLESGADLSTNSTKSYDLGVVTVTGTLTASGAALPDGARPLLRFQNKSTGTTKLRQFATTGATSYAVKLWKGGYDVAAQDDAGAGVLGVGQSLVAPLDSGVSFLTDTAKSYDLSVVTVTGTLTAGGAALPDGLRPALRFQNKASGTAKLRQFNTTGATSYAVKLWKGVYDISVQDDAGAGVLGVGQSLVAKIDSGASFATDTAKSYDLSVVTVTGTLTAAGGALPDGARPVLLFRNKSSGTAKLRQFNPTGATTYAVKLWKGAYDVSVVDDASAGVLGVGQSLAAKLDSAVSFLADTAKSYDLGVVTITGTVTVGGAALPSGARPGLLFQNKTSGTTKVISLPASGVASYSVKVWKGAYDVAVQDDSGAGVLGIGQSLSAKLDSGVSFATDTTKSYDLGVVTINGAVTVAGAALPAGPRPALLFQNITSGTTSTRQFPSSGAAPYTVKLWKGAYDVVARDDSGAGVLGIGQSLATKLIRGCPESTGGTGSTGACTSGNGIWHFFPARSGLDSVELNTTVSGSTLSGTWSSRSGYSGAFTGTKSGNHFTIAFDFTGCHWTLDGTTADCDLHATLSLSCNSATAANGYIEP